MVARLEAIDHRIRECLKELMKAREDVGRIEGEADGLLRAQGLFASDSVKSDDVVTEIKYRLSQNRRRLISARQAVSRLEGELEGLRAAREIVGGGELPLEWVDDLYPQRGRDISPGWRRILGLFIKRLPAPVSIGDVMNFVTEHELGISRNAVRSQLHLYANRGFLKRVGDGLYKATDAVKRVC